MYNEGISKVGDIIDLGSDLDIVEKRGSWYSYGDIRLGQGRENAKEYLQQMRKWPLKSKSLFVNNRWLAASPTPGIKVMMIMPMKMKE